MIGETIPNLSHEAFNQVRGHLLKGPYFKKRCLFIFLLLTGRLFERGVCLTEVVRYYVNENNNFKRYNNNNRDDITYDEVINVKIITVVSLKNDK